MVKSNVFAEKYRPKTFDEVVGQEHIVDTIRSFVKNKRIPHMLFSGVAGTGKCVSGDSLIFVNDTLISFEEYEKIKSDNDVILSECNKKVKGVFYKEATSNIIKLTLDDGTIIKGTPEHKIKVMTPEGIIWKKLSAMDRSDIVLVGCKFDVFPEEELKIVFSYKRHEHDNISRYIPESYTLNRDIAYLIGCIAANGYVSTVGSIGVNISTHKKWLQEKIAGIVKREFNLDVIRQYDKRYEKVTSVRIHSCRLVELLKQLDVKPLTARNKYVSMSIRQSPKGIQLSFLKGLFDCDSYFNGSGIEYYTSSKKLCFMVRSMLMNMGIYCIVKNKYLKEYDHIYWTVKIPSDFTRKFLSYFDNTYKNEKVVFDKDNNTNCVRIPQSVLSNFIKSVLKKYDYSKNGMYRFEDKFIRVDKKYSSVISTNHGRGMSNKKTNELLDLEKGRIDEIEAVFDYIRNNNIFLRKVKSLEVEKNEVDVYDFHIPENHTFICNCMINHNTTIVKVIARELYGADWKQYFLEINASDDRGIDVVREKIKGYARVKTLGNDFKIIFLDEADAMCLTGDTEIIVGSLENPTTRRLDSMIEGRKIMLPSVNPETLELESDKGWMVDSGYTNFLEVTLEDGSTINASKNHPFFKIKDEKLSQIKLEELSVGDEIVNLGVCFGSKVHNGAKIVKIEDIGKQKAWNISMEGNKNFILKNGVVTHNTRDAQQALRRIIEMYSNKCRFILSVNYPNKIIDPIKDRCVLFRFRGIKPENMEPMLIKIAEKEEIDITDSAIHVIALLSRGSMRTALNTLDRLKSGGDTAIDDARIYDIMAHVNDDDIRKLLFFIRQGDDASADVWMDDLLNTKVYAPEEILESLWRLISGSTILSEASRLDALERMGEVEARISAGSMPFFQLRAYCIRLIRLYNESEAKQKLT